jgi:DNA-binding response OmpR family regulator
MIANMTSPLFDPAIAMDEHANFEPALRRVLCVLHKHFGRVVDHNYLMAALYSEDDGEYAASENIMAQRMSLCRRLMTKHTIQNVRGVGYKLVKKETIVS